MDKKGFLKESFHLKRSFHTITCLSITCLIIPLFFLGMLQLFIINVTEAQEWPSQKLQIMLTDENGREFLDGILLDNFEYWNNPHKMGWKIIDFWSPYTYIWNYSSFYLNAVLDFEEGSRVLDVYMPPSVFLIDILKNSTCAIKKKAAYTDPNGAVFQSIPAEFNFLHYKVRAPLAIEQFEAFRFEMEVTTDSNGYAKIVIIPKDKVEGVSPGNFLETVEEDVETISNDQENPSIIKIYIGNKYADNKWHQMEVDLNAAIKKYSSLNEELAQIQTVIVRGNQYRLDDIIFFKSSQCDPHNNLPHLFYIGPVYVQLYGWPPSTLCDRWIYAEDLDLMITAEHRENGIRFPGIADDRGIVLEYENEDPADQNINLETLHVYAYGTDKKIIYHNTPRTPNDADLNWIPGFLGSVL